MNLLHIKRKLLPLSGPQEPVTAFIVANASTIAVSAAVGAVAAAVSGGNVLKGALMGAVLGGVGAAVGGFIGGAAQHAGQAAGTASTAAEAAASALEIGGASAADGLISTASPSWQAAASPPPLSTAATAADAVKAGIDGATGTQAGSTAAAHAASTAGRAGTGLLDGAILPRQGIYVATPGTGLSGNVAAGLAANTGSPGLLDTLRNAFTSKEAVGAAVMTGGNMLAAGMRNKAAEEMELRRREAMNYGTPVNRGALWVR